MLDLGKSVRRSPPTRNPSSGGSGFISFERFTLAEREPDSCTVGLLSSQMITGKSTALPISSVPIEVYQVPIESLDLRVRRRRSYKLLLHRLRVKGPDVADGDAVTRGNHHGRVTRRRRNT